MEQKISVEELLDRPVDYDPEARFTPEEAVLCQPEIRASKVWLLGFALISSRVEDRFILHVWRILNDSYVRAHKDATREMKDLVKRTERLKRKQKCSPS